MKVVILAGGLGSRISEETHLRPKPMIEIGGKPILWHILKIYSHFGLNEFIICCGYKGHMIKEYFSNYFLYSNDVTIDMSSNEMRIHKKLNEPWKITLVDTGVNTMTGGRLLRIKDYIEDDTFCMTYGDGLGDINIKNLIEHHNSKNKLVTLTAVIPSGRFGVLSINNKDQVDNFQEKPMNDANRINGGYFVINPLAFDYIKNDSTIWEQEPLKNLTINNQLNAYKHNGFWQPMDTLRDKNHLEKLWNQSQPPWKIWD